MEFGKAINHKITIEPSDNKGFYAKVGCGRFVFATREELWKALGDYLANPKEWERVYNSLYHTCDATDQPTHEEVQQ